jgi:hypothetical protein
MTVSKMHFYTQRLLLFTRDGGIVSRVPYGPLYLVSKAGLPAPTGSPRFSAT